MKRVLKIAICAMLCLAAIAFTACAPQDGSENSSAQPPAVSGDPQSQVLIVYFSWSSAGNTERMADYIAGQTGAYVVEIVPEIPYSGSYNDVAYGRAQEEAETNARPAVSQETYDQIDISRYDTVLVGFPIWWHTAPMIIGTFLEHYEWTAGTDIYPFFQGASNSNESYYENSMTFVRTSASGATVHEGLYASPSNTSAIDAWLEENGLV